MAWPKQGTVAVTLNSTTVTGTSTAFAANARVGDGFKGPDGAWYEITNIASDTVLSILPAYAGATGTGKAYAIVPVQGYDKALADAFNALVQQFGTQLGSNSFKALTGLVGAPNKLGYFTAADGMATTDFTAQARELLNDTTYGAMLTTLGVSDFIKTLLDDVDQATALATLGAPAAATLPAAGTNLLNDDYSWLGATLPTLVLGQSLTALSVAVSAATTGYGYQCTLPSTATNQYLMLCPSNNAAGYNVDLVPGTYVVSAYIQGSVAGTIRTSLYNGTHRYSDTVAFTAARTRVTMTVVVTDSARAAVTFYPNMSGLAAGTTVTIDSVMVETRLGSISTPSAFVAGPSAPAVARLPTTIAAAMAALGLGALAPAVTDANTLGGGSTTFFRAAASASNIPAASAIGGLYIGYGATAGVMVCGTLSASGTIGNMLWWRCYNASTWGGWNPVAAAGANSTITSLTGLTTALSVAQGGTGVATMAALLSALQAAGAYGKTNAVGTVSQASGVPTGAIIETGTNANGTYIKWADGTMICTYLATSAVNTGIAFGTGLYASPAASYNFPSTFANLPRVTHFVATPGANLVWTATEGSLSASAVAFRAISVSSGANAYVGFNAIGRWY